MSGKLSESELSGLTPEERKAWDELEADTTDENLADVAGDDEDEEETEEPGGDDEETGDDEPPADEPPADDKPADDPDDAPVVADDVPEVAFIPKFSGEILPKFQGEIDALTAKFEEGELPMSEFLKETRKIEAQSRNEETQGQLWDAEQATFFKYNPDFKPEKNRILCGALNQEVIRLANSQESAGLTGIQILYAARDAVNKAFGVVKEKAGNQSKPKEQAKPKAQRPDIKTLGGVPAADSDSDVGTGKFSHLDKLEGLQLEKAVSKMTPAEQAEWLRSS